MMKPGMTLLSVELEDEDIAFIEGETARLGLESASEYLQSIILDRMNAQARAEAETP
jgi:hypothetical protein